jgi:tetratricopeptide (TPR) repeat protein
MRSAMDRFYGKIKSDSVAMFFFSGFGIQSDRQTYMVPVNAQIWTEADVRRDAYSLDSVLAEMNRKGARVKIAILDASRRNPFERRFRTVAAGLAPVAAPSGTVVMYAAAPGTVVREGERELFVNELLKEMRAAGKVEEAFNRTLAGVSRTSQNEQVPWFSSTLVEEFSFVAPGRPSQTAIADPDKKQPPSVDPEADARRDYQSAERTGTKTAWQDFVAKHPTGRYADLARTQLAKLEPPPDPEADVRRAYQAAERTGTKTAWQDFVAKYPTGRYADLARTQIAKLDPPPDLEADARRDYQSAERTATKTAWQDFVAKHPTGRYADLARTQIAKLEPPPPVKPKAPVDDPAIRELDSKIQLNPSDGSAFYKRGQLYAKNGDFGRAITDFDTVIRLDPKDAEAFNNRCWARAIVGDLQAALKDCNEALQLRPRYVDAFDSRGFVNLKSGQPAKAIADYDAALRINPKLASSLYGRGMAKSRAGNAASANADIAAAKAIQSNIADEFADYGIR